MRTERQFESIKLVNFRSSDNHVIQRLHKILEKFAPQIKRLEIASSVLPEFEAIRLLNMVAQVDAIFFYDFELIDSIADNEQLQLRDLRKFQFHLCNVKVPKLLLQLSHPVLRRLTIEHCILKREVLHQIFDTQSNICELEFDPYYVNPLSLQHLKLNKVKLMSNRNIAAILANQPQLTSLDLSKAHIGDNEFLEICNLSKLKSLKLWIDRVSWEILANLSRLRCLSELSLNYDRLEVEYVTHVASLALPSLESLRIKFPRLKITAENFLEFSTNMPRVKKLNISNQSVGVIGALIENFSNLETLVIGCDSDSSEVVEFTLNGARHTKLKELCIYSSYADQKTLKCSKSILDIVNSSLINLERLKLQNVIALSVDQLKEIISSHPALTHLLVDNAESTFAIDNDTISTLKCTKPLRYFQSRGAEISIHKKSLEKAFSKQFAVVNVKPWKRQLILRSCRWEHADD